jgi:hypothetical protein
MKKEHKKSRTVKERIAKDEEKIVEKCMNQKK